MKSRKVLLYLDQKQFEKGVARLGDQDVTRITDTKPIQNEGRLIPKRRCEWAWWARRTKGPWIFHVL
jgi:hypothetical protein